MQHPGYDANRQENITPIHEDHDDAANPGEIGEVTRNHKKDGDDVVGHHLPEIFASSFRIQNEDLMSVEGHLKEIVDFDWSRQGYVRITAP